MMVKYRRRSAALNQQSSYPKDERVLFTPPLPVGVEWVGAHGTEHRLVDWEREFFLVGRFRFCLEEAPCMR